MKNDLRTKILASKPTMVEPVDVPAWGVTVYVKELTLAERDKFEAGQVRRNADGTAFLDTVGLKARLVALTACDENGDLIFDESDVDSIMGLGAAGVEVVFTVAQRVNKMRKEDQTNPGN